MGRPKGSKNKTIEVRQGLFVDNKQATLAQDCNFLVNYDKKSSELLIETSGQDSFKAFVEGENIIKCYELREAATDKNREDWFGGTRRDIKDAEAGKFNIKPFLAQKEKLQKTFGSLDFLEAELSRKRTRFLSEHDGELDFDRLYEREPFHNTRVTNNGITRVMDINVDFTFSAGVNANEITEYGTTVWAVMDILEKSGVRCNVFINTHCINQSNGTLSILDYKTRIKIKSTEEYMDTTDLARHFTANYYRRVIFGTWALTNEAIGREMRSGYGNVKHWDRDTKPEKGVLNLAITQMRDFKLDSNKLVQYIKESL